MQIRGEPGRLLPLVEQIDPSLVPEVFWRAVAARPADRQSPLAQRCIAQRTGRLFWAWYDREVAAAVFEPVRALMEQTDDRELASAGGSVSELAAFGSPRHGGKGRATARDD